MVYSRVVNQLDYFFGTIVDYLMKLRLDQRLVPAFSSNGDLEIMLKDVEPISSNYLQISGLRDDIIIYRYTIKSDQQNRDDMQSSDDLLQIVAAITVCEWYVESVQQPRSTITPETQTINLAMNLLKLSDYSKIRKFVLGGGSKRYRTWAEKKMYSRAVQRRVVNPYIGRV